MKPFLLRGHEKPVTVVKFNYDGDLLFTGSAEKKVNMWYALSGERVGSFEPSAAVRTLDVTNDSKYLVIGTNVGTLEIFKVDGGHQLGLISMQAKILTVQFSLGDKKLLVLAEGYGAKDNNKTEFLIYDFDALISKIKDNQKSETLNIAAEKTLEFKNKFTQIAWGFLNKHIIAAGEDGTLKQIDLTGKVIKSEELHPDAIRSFTIAKDFSLMLTCSTDGAKLLDPATFEVRVFWKTEVPMNTGAISPSITDPINPKYHAIIAGGVMARDAAKHKQGGFEIRIVNVIYGGDELGKIAGHFGPVNALAFYPDGRGFVSGGEEGIIRLFRFDKKYYSDPVFE